MAVAFGLLATRALWMALAGSSANTNIGPAEVNTNWIYVESALLFLFAAWLIAAPSLFPVVALAGHQAFGLVEALALLGTGAFDKHVAMGLVVVVLFAASAIVAMGLGLLDVWRAKAEDRPIGGA